MWCIVRGMKRPLDSVHLRPFDANGLDDLVTLGFSGYWILFMDAFIPGLDNLYGSKATAELVDFLTAHRNSLRLVQAKELPTLMLAATRPQLLIELGTFRWVRALPFTSFYETTDPAVISYDDTPARVLAYRPDSNRDGCFIYPLPDGDLRLITPNQAEPIYLQNDFVFSFPPTLRDRHRESSLTILIIFAGLAFCSIISGALSLGAALKNVLFFWVPFILADLGLHHLIRLLCPNHGRRLRLLVDAIKGTPNLFYRYRDRPTPLHSIALLLAEILGFLLLAVFLAYGFHRTFAPDPKPLDTQPPAVTAADLLDRLERLRAAAQPQAIDVTAEALAPIVRVGTPLLIEYNAAERLIHPYRLGTNPKSGKLLLRAWEETKAGQPTNAFRTYEVAKITRAQTLPGHAPIDLPPQAYAPDKTIPSPIAERPK